jgi:twitching motility protein PilU
MKEAMEKSMTPGSQTFEQSLFKMYKDGLISKEEALGNADSATNLLWMMNQSDGSLGAAPAAGAEKKPQTAPSAAESAGSFSEFKLLADEQAPR